MDTKKARSNNDQNSSQKNLERRLRHRERKHYTEDCINDEEIEGKRMFSVEEKVFSDRFKPNFVQEMKGDELTIAYFQEHGFVYPIVIKEKTGLGMRLPSKNFTVNDVRQCVGSRRMLDVMDVTTQKDIEMTMKEWVKYYENPHRDKLLNVISLEFSHTKLENYIESPRLVREVDWVDRVWPPHLKQSQTESTNLIDDMRYPKVQKYCLMSVKGCYTDFHIDFGGTSVWYHILHGRKVFWLIPPTETNIQLYEQWVLSGKQGDVFFGDTVDECGRIELEEGWTFFIPTGWIHAVYTPMDSLVFGGNFLHSFGIEKQLRIAQVEDVTHVPPKFRYPFYTEMLWYVLARYVHCLLGATHVADFEEVKAEKTLQDGGKESEDLPSQDVILPFHTYQTARPSSPPVTSPLSAPTGSDCVKSPCSSVDDGISSPVRLGSDITDDVECKENLGFLEATLRSPVASQLTTDAGLVSVPEASGTDVGKLRLHLTRYEIIGLKAIAIWLSHLSTSKRNVPDLIKDPLALLGDVKTLLEKHRNDDPKLAITGKPILSLPEAPKRPRPKSRMIPLSPNNRPPQSKSSGRSSSSSARRRRTRCKKCEACLRADCGECHFCKDMKKFGGLGRMKQSCISRQCMAPVLPHTACCMVCGKDGWVKGTEPADDEASSLMECSICWEIVHPECLGQPIVEQDDGPVSDDLPNSWECPKCCQNPKGSGPPPKLHQIKPGRPKSDMCHARGTKRKKESKTNVDAPVDATKLPLSEELPVTIKRTDVQTVVGRESWKKHKVDDSDSDDDSDSSTDDSDSETELKSIDSFSRIGRKMQEEKLSMWKLDAVVSGRSLGVKRVGEAHVRSCVRQQQPQALIPPPPPPLQQKPINTCKPLTLSLTEMQIDSKMPPFLFSHSVSKMEKLNEKKVVPPVKVENGVKPSDAIDQRMPVTTAVESKTEDPSGVKGLINCHIKVMKCDEGSANNRPPPKRPPNISALCSGSSPSFKSVTRNGHSGVRSAFLNREMNLKKPLYVVRPAPILDTGKSGNRLLTTNGSHNPALDKDAMLCVFRRLSSSDLCRCMLVCKVWNAWCLDRRLWSKIDLAQKKIATAHLAGIVRRQPSHLGLGWTNISKKLLGWLLARLPQLRHLDLSGCPWSSVMGLVTCNCPLLECLELKWVDGMTDSRFRDLLSPPRDSRPGLLESKSRLRNLSELKLSGCDVTDVSLRYLTQHLRQLTKLDLSNCIRISDGGIALLAAAGSPIRDVIVHLDLSACKRLTDNCLEHLKRCSNLVHVDLRNCPEVSITACRKFIAQSKHPLMMSECKVMEKQLISSCRFF